MLAPSSVDPRIIRRRRIPVFLDDAIGRWWIDGAWR
jgi:hypothetical protein